MMLSQCLNKRILVAFAVILTFGIVAILPAQSGAEDFPLRSKYPMVTPISTNDLAGIFDQVLIVDARNSAEYDVVHMSGASNILVGKMTEADLLKIRSKDDSKPLVFYCNGVTCSKSYKASKKAVEWGFKSVRCYDAGIFTWANAQPGKTEFFGKTMTADNIKTSLISKDDFNKVLLPSKEFLEKSKTGQYTIIDIRDPNERSETEFKLPKLKVMSFDTLLKLINNKSKAIPSSNLLIAGNVGKQVRWLQYYLERAGFTDYYFLKGGVRQWKKDGYGS